MDEETIEEKLESLEWEKKYMEKHLKWCVDNNKPQEQIGLAKEILNEIKEELKNLKLKVVESSSKQECYKIEGKFCDCSGLCRESY